MRAAGRGPATWTSVPSLLSPSPPHPPGPAGGTWAQSSLAVSPRREEVEPEGQHKSPRLVPDKQRPGWTLGTAAGGPRPCQKWPQAQAALARLGDRADGRGLGPHQKLEDPPRTPEIPASRSWGTSQEAGPEEAEAGRGWQGGRCRNRASGPGSRRAPGAGAGRGLYPEGPGSQCTFTSRGGAQSWGKGGPGPPVPTSPSATAPAPLPSAGNVHCACSLATGPGHPCRPRPTARSPHSLAA